MTINKFEKKMMNEIDLNNQLVNEKTTFLSRVISQLFKKKMDRIRSH